MKIQNDQQLTKYAIPDGEGFNALPIFFSLTPYPSPNGRGGKGNV